MGLGWLNGSSLFLVSFQEVLTFLLRIL
uniref:Uncharacterized protein n=1 Tax=Arundo donax TaxID=35708 RepID=A0A0A8YEJ2_ARUDO